MTTIRSRAQKASFLAAMATTALLVTSIFAFAIPTQQVYAGDPLFGPSVAVAATYTANFGEFQVAGSGNSVYVIWKDNNALVFAKSTDNGATFDNTINLSQKVNQIYSPVIVSSGSNVYVVWVDKTLGDNEIFFARSVDNGRSFSTPVNLSGNRGDSILPRIAVDGKNVFVAWSDNTAGNYEVLLRTSKDGGATFTDAINLSNSTGDSILQYQNQIVTSGTNVYVVWQDNTLGTLDIYFARSTDGGANFHTINLSNTRDNSHHPEIAVSDNNVYVIWSDKTRTGGVGYDLYFARSTDGGANFSNTAILCHYSADKNCGESHRIVAAGSNVYVIRTQYPEGLLLLARSVDNGATFGDWVNLSGNTGMASNAQIALAGSSVYVVWQSKSQSNYEVLFTSSKDSGTTFGNVINLSNNIKDSGGPQMIVTEDKVHIIWMDVTLVNDAAVDADIFLKTGAKVIA